MIQVRAIIHIFSDVKYPLSDVSPIPKTGVSFILRIQVQFFPRSPLQTLLLMTSIFSVGETQDIRVLFRIFAELFPQLSGA